MKILPVFIPHQGCPFKCIYCDQTKISGTDKISPEKISKIVKDFCYLNLQYDKEIAFYGGTFTNLDPEIIKFYLGLISPYLDKKTYIRISTRPDCLDEKIINYCFLNGVRTVELGIQSFSNLVLKKSRRGYNSDIAFKGCQLIKKMGFKLGIQLMPGLPGFSSETLEVTLNKTIMIKPEFVRIYPTIILRNTDLENWYIEKTYTPLNLEETIKYTAYMLEKITTAGIKVIKIGLHSDIDPAHIIAGPYHQNLGELVKAYLLENKILRNFDPSKTLVISQKDISLFRGNDTRLIKKLKRSLHVDKLKVDWDSGLKSGEYIFKNSETYKVW